MSKKEKKKKGCKRETTITYLAFATVLIAFFDKLLDFLEHIARIIEKMI